MRPPMRSHMRILVTGSAGFIGFHLVLRLCREGHQVTGIDNLNSYYDISLKEGRLAALGITKQDVEPPCHSRTSPCHPRTSSEDPSFSFIKMDLKDHDSLEALFTEEQFDCVIHLAAQAGVRYSIENPRSYIDSNIVGFFNILECCRHYKIPHLIFASSSSVYGANSKIPFSVDDRTDEPLSLYAATKKADELMAHSYAHLYGLPCQGLRFFTVYGPWGRPDMAPFLFTRAILEGKPIKVFNQGNMKRDFTYIDDIVESIIRILPLPPEAPFKVYNIGRGEPVDLMDFIHTIEKYSEKKAIMEMLPMQDGDVPLTWADTADLEAYTGYKPHTNLDQGIKAFVSWYRDFYHC